MTLADHAARAADHLPGGRAKLSPILFAMLMAALMASVGELVSRCWDKLWPRQLAAPGVVDRWRLKNGIVWRACGKVADDPQFAGHHNGQADVFRLIGGDVSAALLSYGKTLTDAECAELRAIGAKGATA